MRSVGALCVVSLAIVTACTAGGHSAGGTAARTGLGPTPSVTASLPAAGGISLAMPPANTLRWPYTGALPMEGRATMDALAYQAFARARGGTPNALGAGGAIWAGVLPDGQRLVVVQTWALGTRVMHTVAYTDRAGRDGRIVKDLTLAEGTQAFTVLVHARRSWAVTFRATGAQIRPA